MRARVKASCVSKGCQNFGSRTNAYLQGIQPLQILVSRRPNGVYLYFVFDHLEAAAPCRRSEESGWNKRRPRTECAGDSRMAARSDAGVWIIRAVAGLQRKMSRGRRLGSKSRQKTVAQLAKHSQSGEDSKP